jgi:hypothetical protein
VLRAEVEARIVDLLVGAPTMRSAASRALLAEWTQYYSRRRLQVPDNAFPRQWLLGLVREACAGEAGPAALRDAVAVIDPDSGAHAELARLVESWHSADLAATARIRWHGPASPGRAAPAIDIVDVWAELSAELSTVPAETARAAFEEATVGRALTVPWHCSTAWHLFVHLTDHGGHPAEPEPYQLFLVALLRAGWLSPRLERLAEAWARAVATEHGTVVAALLPAPPPGPEPDRPVHLVTRLEHAGPAGSRWRLSWALVRYRPTALVGAGNGTEGLGRDQLEPAVSDLVRATERGLSHSAGTLVLEFALPFDLLDLAVEWWHKTEPYGPSKPFATSYIVTLRSLERMQNPEWHRVWRERWRHVHAPAESVTHWCETSLDDDPLRLAARLGARPELVVLVLSGPPLLGTRGHDELVAGLSAGIAAIVWTRPDDGPQGAADDGALAAELRKYLGAGPAADLPAGAHRLRVDAQIRASDRPSALLGLRLVLLWDDPERFADVHGG